MNFLRNRKKQQFCLYVLTLILNLISFLIIFLLNEHHYSSSQNILLIVKVCSTLILLLIMIYTYFLRKPANDLFKINIYNEISIFLMEISPFFEILLFINIDFHEYMNNDGPSWIIYFRICNFLIKSFFLHFLNYGFESSSSKKRITAIFMLILVILNIYCQNLNKVGLTDILLIIFELCLLVYTFYGLLSLILTKRSKKEEVFCNFLDFERDGILIVKEAVNNKYHLTYYNEKILKFFNIRSKNKMNYSLLDHEIKTFLFQKIKNKEDIYLCSKQSIKNENLNSLSEILSYCKSMNQNDLSLNFLFMRSLNESETKLHVPRLKLNLKKAIVCNHTYYYFTFMKMENFLNLKDKCEYKNRLLNAFTHEIRTPLNGSIPILQELSNQRENFSEENRFCIDNALVSLKLLENSLNNLTDYSLMSYDQFIINMTMIDIEELLAEIFMIVKTQINLKNLDFCINVDTRLLNRKIMTDYNRVKQLLLNLLLNSIQFTFKGNIILDIFVIHESPLIIEFNVHDTGIGIDAEKLKLLKQKLLDGEQNEFQLNSSGSCLGLTISQQLALLLGKNGIEIVSTFNEGTSIKFKVNDQNNNDSNVSLGMMLNLNDYKTTAKSLKNVSISTKNIQIIEFSKYLNSIRNKNIIFNKSVKDQTIGNILSCRNDSRSENCSNDSLAYESRIMNIESILKNHDFDKIKETNEINAFNIIQFKSNDKIHKEDEVVLVQRKNREKTLTIFSIINSSHSNPIINEDLKIVEEVINSQKMLCHNDDILLVDDDAFNLFSMELILKGFNLKCDKAMNGKEAINKIKTKKCEKKENCKCGYKLIFMDFQMPVMNGEEATIEIKNMIEKKEVNSVCIIGCTAFTTKDEIMKCLNAGMKDVIFKPVSRNVISNIIKEWI